MKYNVWLRDTSVSADSGVIYEDPAEYQDEEEMLNHWADGSFGCDCNRSMVVHDLGFDDCYPCNSDANVIVMDNYEVRE